MFSQADTIHLTARYGYEPQNGILFYGSNNAFLGFLEICLKCNGSRHTNCSFQPLTINGKDFYELKEIVKRYNIGVE